MKGTVSDMDRTGLLAAVGEYSRRPVPFAKGTGNIWTEPYLASQMLAAHLDGNTDGASRRERMIGQTVAYLTQHFAPGGAVLDLGCGPGLYAERLAELGYRVTGVDFSENSVRYARERAGARGLAIEYLRADFLDLRFCGTFDAVMQIYGEINTFSDAERDRLLAMVYGALKPGGLFAFDVTTPARRAGQGQSASWYTADGGFFRPGRHLVLESTLPYENDVWLEQYIVADDASVAVYRNWFHEYTPAAIEELLRGAGFSAVTVSGGLYGAERESADWITVLAQK